MPKILIYFSSSSKSVPEISEGSKNKTGLPVHIAEDPLFSVAKGTGMVLENIKKYSEVLIHP